MKNSDITAYSSYLCKAAAAASPKILIEMGLLASLGCGDFLRLEEEEEGEGERAAAGLCRPETDGETIVGTRMAFWDAVSMCVCAYLFVIT